jgi:short coiled-coil protein
MADKTSPPPAASSAPEQAPDLHPQERNQLEEYLLPSRSSTHIRQAKSLQDGLSMLLDRIDSVKEEYQKLQTENKLLQEWIGNSIQQNAKAKPRS